MKYISQIRKQQPLIHCITNYVAANFQANGLLAIGASPVMADSREEMREITEIASGLLINIGTLNGNLIETMVIAGKHANERNIPVVLDPVGAGASQLRKETALRLLNELDISLLRCNAGELAAIAGISWNAKGVDSGQGEGDVKAIAEEVAKRYKCLVAVTGETDVLTDGIHSTEISGGDSRMPCITGSGCLLSAICCAFLSAAKGDQYEAILEGLTFFKGVAEYAGSRADKLGNFHTEVINGLAEIGIETKNAESRAVTMTIAGSDSGGGAGIQADLKTFQELGVFGTSAITAVTAQNTRGVQDVYPIEPEGVALQMKSVLEDFQVKSIKTGMLFSAPIIHEVAQVLRDFPDPVLVVDPVMIAKGGASLLLKEAIEAFKKELLPLANVITPNLPEAEVLAEMSIENDMDRETAARRILDLGTEVVVMKGGHYHKGTVAEDVIFTKSGEVYTLTSPWVETKNTHGTGCTFSAAIAANLAMGKGIKQSILEAKQFIYAAISDGLQLGNGHGPTNHWAYQSVKNDIGKEVFLHD